jgi:hypothetical protein
MIGQKTSILMDVYVTNWGPTGPILYRDRPPALGIFRDAAAELPVGIAYNIVNHGIEGLERLWAEHLGADRPGAEEGAVEGGLRVALARHRARERWLRGEKIAQAKRVNGGRLPCEVCGFDFFEAYGDLGRDYAQVHHLKTMGDRTSRSRTRLEDLAVVCANCLVILHRGGEVIPLEGLLKQKT